jgi:Haem-binding domain
MRLQIKWIAVATFLLLVIQLVQVDRSNPDVDSTRTIYATLPVPAEVKTVFQRSCKNCHSNETAWPWYSYIAPVSWVVAHDVHQARKMMNLSEWGTYSAQRKEDKLEEICEQVIKGEMPDRKYAMFHREARVTSQQRDAVCQWTEDSRQY